MDDTIKKSPLLQQVVNQIRVRHYSRRTEDTYLHWVKRYIYFHNKRHPKDMSEREVGSRGHPKNVSTIVLNSTSVFNTNYAMTR
jgi:hypothetical protein